MIEADVERYERDGFLAFDRVVPDAEVCRLRAAFDELLGTGADGNRMWGGITRQVMMPCLHHPAFHDNGALAAGAEIAAQLLGAEAVRTFDMLVFKPSGHPHATPWHQDMAYAELPCAPPGVDIPLLSVQIWFALDHADVDNGCMHFVRGVHRKPLLEHAVLSGDPQDDARLLGIVEPQRHFRTEDIVPCPLPAGGATVHSYGTPHFTPVNRSDRPRRAYIVNYLTVPTLEAAVEMMLLRLEAQGLTDTVAEVRAIVRRRDMMTAMNTLTPYFREFMTESRQGS